MNAQTDSQIARHFDLFKIAEQEGEDAVVPSAIAAVKSFFQECGVAETDLGCVDALLGGARPELALVTYDLYAASFNRYLASRRERPRRIQGARNIAAGQNGSPARSIRLREVGPQHVLLLATMRQGDQIRRADGQWEDDLFPTYLVVVPEAEGGEPLCLHLNVEARALGDGGVRYHAEWAWQIHSRGRDNNRIWDTASLRGAGFVNLEDQMLGLIRAAGLPLPKPQPAAASRATASSAPRVTTVAPQAPQLPTPYAAAAGLVMHAPVANGTPGLYDNPFVND